MKKIAYILLSGVLGFALFSRCVGFSYIGLDDAAYTFRNPFVAGGLSVQNAVEAFANFRHGGIWMPVTYISYMLDASICRWTGLPLVGEMHFVNVLLHVANFLLLVKLIRLLLGNGERGTGNGEWGSVNLQSETRNSELETRNQLSTINYQLSTIIAALAAMIWAVHPLRAEPVAWIAARKELLWSLFTLSGIILWIRGMRDAGCGMSFFSHVERVDRVENAGRGIRDEEKVGECVSEGLRNEKRNPQSSTFNSQLSTLICCALACLSKPTAMCFPFLLLLVTWWLRKEGKVGECVSGGVRNGGEDTRQATVVPCAKSQLHNNSPRLCVSALKTNTPPPTPNSQLTTTFYPLSLIPCHLVIAATTAAIAAYSQTHVAGQDSVALYAAPFAHRLVNALSAIGYYLRATFWPFGLHVDCRAVPGLWPIGAGWNFAALGGAVLAVGLWKYLTRNSKLETTKCQLPTTNYQLSTTISFSALWFLISLSPTLGLFGSFGMEAHADRFAYLPSMAFAFLLAGFLRRSGTGATSGTVDTRQPTSGAAIVNRDAEGGRAGVRPSHSYQQPTTNYQLPTTDYQLPTVLVIALLSVVTFQQLSYWRDDWAAHARTIACDPGHPRAMVHVADARCSRQRDFDGGIRLYRKALSLAGTVPKGGFNVADVKARLAYALASRGGYDDFAEVKRLGAEVLHDFRLDRRGMMLDALGTAFMAEGDLKRAALLFKASIEAPDRFWPKASTRRKLERCR